MSTSSTPKHRVVLPALLVIAAAAAAHAHPDPPASRPTSAAGETCLVLSAENLVSDKGNWYIYIEISNKAYTIQTGDRLEYDIFVPAVNPLLKGGIDIDLSRGGKLPGDLANRPWARDAGIKDQNGLTLHGDAILSPAKDQWYHRVFDLAPIVTTKSQRWSVVFEGDSPGRYVQMLDNIRVTHDGKTVCSIYENGRAPEITVQGAEGYSRNVLIAAVPRERTMNGERVTRILDMAKKANEMRVEHERFRSELVVARDLAA